MLFWIERYYLPFQSSKLWQYRGLNESVFETKSLISSELFVQFLFGFVGLPTYPLEFFFYVIFRTIQPTEKSLNHSWIGKYIP